MGKDTLGAESLMKILIIANARRSGGLSGGDNIYLNLAKHFPCKVKIWDMLNIDFKPFWLCYGYRILVACITALFWKEKYDFVYSASDFLMDSLPGYIMKLKGNRWIAGFYLFAPKYNRIYYWTQRLAYWIIRKKADIVFITNDSMRSAFKHKFTVSVNGGIDLEDTGLGNEERIYDAVFVGRIHKTKGIDELIRIWEQVRIWIPDASLAIIGDGDMGEDYIKKNVWQNSGITYFGYQGKERFAIYKSAKCVLYPTPEKYDHFSMAPVEAMACGCPLIAFNIPVMKTIKPPALFVEDEDGFAHNICKVITADPDRYTKISMEAYLWAKGWDWKRNAFRIFNIITERLCLNSSSEKS